MTSPIYVPNMEKWRRHFVRMAEGKTNPNHRGQYLVDSIQSGGDADLSSKIKVVTPVAQAVELAKSELAQERKEAITVPRVYKSKPVTSRKRKRSPKIAPLKKRSKQSPVWFKY